MKGHLSETALQEILMGLGAAADREHLDGCPQCRAQAEAFQEQMRLFNLASMAWSEARPRHTMVSERLRTGASGMPHPRLQWALAGALLLLTAAGAPFWMHRHQPEAPAQIASVQEDSARQIAEDNQLLHNVDAALAATDEPPVTQYNISQGLQRPRHRRPETRMQ